MHELALCQGVIQALENAAVDQGFSRVLAVSLKVGKLVALEKSQFEFSFALLSKNTLAENASLVINEVAGEGFCPHCQRRVPMSSLYCACAYCNEWGLELVQGNELKIDNLEVC